MSAAERSRSRSVGRVVAGGAFLLAGTVAACGGPGGTTALADCAPAWVLEREPTTDDAVTSDAHGDVDSRLVHVAGDVRVYVAEPSTMLHPPTTIDEPVCLVVEADDASSSGCGDMASLVSLAQRAGDHPDDLRQIAYDASGNVTGLDQVGETWDVVDECLAVENI